MPLSDLIEKSNKSKSWGGWLKESVENFSMATITSPISNLNNNIKYALTHPSEILIKSFFLMTSISVVTKQFPQVAADSTSAQYLTSFGGSGDDYALGASVTDDGGIVVTGLTKSFGALHNNILLSKHSANGTMLWTNVVQGNGWQVGVCLLQVSNNGVVMGGYTDTVGAGGYDVLFAQVAPNGSLLWSVTFGGGLDDAMFSIQKTSGNNIIAAGYANGHLDGDGASNGDLAIVEFSNNGTVLWANICGGSGDNYGRSIQETSSGEFLVAGYSNGYGVGNYDIILTKWQNNGTFLWSKTFGGINNDTVGSLQITTDGAFVAIGSTNSFGKGNTDVLLIKWWSNGSLVWAMTLGGNANDFGNSLQQTSDDGLLILGQTNSFGDGSAEVLLAKYWNNGTFYNRFSTVSCETNGNSILRQ